MTYPNIYGIYNKKEYIFMMEEDYNLELIKDFEKREKENKVELISLSDFRKELGV